MRILFHKSVRDLVNEDWYYLCKDSDGLVYDVL